MKLYLDSDFRDYYDVWFDSYWLARSDGEEEIVLSRHSKGTYSRGEALERLARAGYTTPKHGRDWIDVLGKNNGWLVGYSDIFAHRGDGKWRMYVDVECDLNPRYVAPDRTFYWPSIMPQYYAEYLAPDHEPDQHGVVSYRLLVIGRTFFRLRYAQDDPAEWRSNVGSVRIDLVTEEDVRGGYSVPYRSSAIDEPLYAVDFIRHHGIYYAIDLNLSPGIGDTPVQDILSGPEVVEALKDYYHHKGKGRGE